MWDTVDSWGARSVVVGGAEHPGQGDHSAGLVRAAATASRRSSRSTRSKILEGQDRSRRRATRRRNWLLLYLLSQSGLTPEDKKANSRRTWCSRPRRRSPAAAFKAKKVDAAVTWEPDLSGAVKAREDEAHVLVSTAAATNVIRRLPGRAAGRDRQGADDAARLRARLVRRHRHDRQGSGRLLRGVRPKALKLGPDDISGMLSA